MTEPKPAPKPRAPRKTAAPKAAPAPAPEETEAPALGDRVLRAGDSGPDVSAVQAALGADVDGEFGPLTERAVKNFQKRRGLAMTGVVDVGLTWPRVIRALEKKAAPDGS